MTMEHTATETPWSLVEGNEHHGPYITSDWGTDIADLYTMSNPQIASVRNGGKSYPVLFDNAAANAAFIVTAVNSYASSQAEIARLRAALERIATGEFVTDNWVAEHALAALSEAQS